MNGGRGRLEVWVVVVGGWGGAAECQYQITGRLSAGTHATLQAEPSVEMRIYYKLIKLSLSLSLSTPSLSICLSLSFIFFLIASV